MALDMNLLFGEMAGSALLHLFFPLFVSVLYGGLPTLSMSGRVWLMIGLVAALSMIAQFFFLAQLQASSCSGVKDYKSILKGSFIAALISGVMVAIPMYMESMRLIVSQLFGDHKVLLTPQLSQINSIIAGAASQVADVSQQAQQQAQPQVQPQTQTGGAIVAAPLTAVEYEQQTLKEMTFGAAYWAAFAGAYGIGVGSLFASVCPATQ